MDDVLGLDAVGQARAVRDGQISARELAEAAIARIEAHDGELNAVIHRRFERALAEIDAIPEDAPFRGVPILLKDLGWRQADEPYAAGSNVRDGVEPGLDGYGVVRLRQAGFVMLGRTNTPEFGSTITTEPVAFGPTRNPYDPAYSAGGSSGGSAAAVAAGMVALATASDGGGSIRVPASLCGLVGLKPTRGRVSAGPALGEGWSGFSCAGFVSRSVRDTAAALDVVSGMHPGDPYDAPPLPGPLAGELGREPGRLRVGFITRHPNGTVPESPELTEAVTGAAALLESLGHDVAPGGPEALAEPGFAGRFGAIVANNLAAHVASLGELRGKPVRMEELEPHNAAMLGAARGHSAADHILATQWMDAFRRRMAAWWSAGHDLLLMPSLGVAPFRLGWLPPDDLATAFRRTGHAVAYTSPINATGQPAISLPLHRTEAGLPVGVQLVAAAGREDLLIRVAAQVERARPFQHAAMR
ncbi:amidase [Nonomuraea phyllanthi]|uniref:Amidase n=1 Tax=Nonomuraea phyllanthi TaxID=2219224 RepID=A0A5C4WUC6_9ACTN|nr:amidase [Nonomuraea phyllanthi]KAB8196478.1 amidase [Nonomuraea phyllanthi]QFY13806.1 amidase [Nonomuraea phyllanthi]